MLHVVLALDGRPDVGMRLDINQPLQPVPLGEPGHDAFAMLPNAPRKIAGHAGVQNAIRPVGHDVDPRPSIAQTVGNRRPNGNAFVDGRDKPGHDDEGRRC